MSEPGPKLWQNGTLKLAIQVAAIVFAAGGLWFKVGAMEGQIVSVEARLGAIENVLMEGRK